MTRYVGACPACGSDDGLDGEYGLICRDDDCRVVFYKPTGTVGE